MWHEDADSMTIYFFLFFMLYVLAILYFVARTGMKQDIEVDTNINRDFIDYSKKIIVYYLNLPLARDHPRIANNNGKKEKRIIE